MSLSSGDCDGQVMGESPVHVQEVVIHMDPRQLNQALLLKNEGEGQNNVTCVCVYVCVCVFGAFVSPSLDFCWFQ